MKKKSCFLLMLLLSVLLIHQNVYARVFSDTKSHWAKNYIDHVTKLGIMSGYNNGTFRPDAYMSRAEFYSMINQLAGQKKTYTVTFSDVSTADWFYNDIAKGIKAGYITPTTGKLNPNASITREEVCEIFGYMYSLKKNPAETEAFSDYKSIRSSARGYVGTMVKVGVISGYPEGQFKPKNGMKRGEVSSLICALLQKYDRPSERVVIDSNIKFGDRNLYD